MAGQYRTWREYFAPLIADVIGRFPQDCAERKKALREVWPRNEERKYWPYKVYLDEIARQTGRKPRRGVRTDRRPVPGHLELPFA